MLYDVFLLYSVEKNQKKSIIVLRIISIYVLFRLIFIKEISMRLKSIAIIFSCFFVAYSSASEFNQETQAYKTFVVEQIDQLVLDTEKFVGYLKVGDLQKAKEIYPLARMYFERSEPIAESFGDLDPRIDARLADLTEEGKSEDEWSGFHKIEKILWEKNTTEGTAEIAEQLLKDVKELRAKIPTADVTPELMITGAVDLLNEVSTTKVTGEEEIYSKTDLYDFKANIEGAEKIYLLFKPQLLKRNADLSQEIEARFAEVNTLLAKHNQVQEGYQYISYDKLTSQEIKALAEAVNKLGEPLAQMGVLLEK